ncbi:hypothetical protein WR25_14977 [Diploscapter pachys]|uniref:C-type lectin domain-containing protein n=1 Tax=Diploscapter pachys TaxID=2018661 RepID=A0A2A2K1G4_9BILA|nr:hypothetical protein WR25_14977 [Diploscapter pachys]
MQLKFELLLLSALLLAVFSRAEAQCDEGYTSFENYCYKANKTEVSPAEAITRCLEEGGMAASIHSQEENDFILGLFGPDPPELATIGLFTVIDYWLWLDQSNLDWNKTGLFEPALFNCFAIALVDGEVDEGQWMTVDCGTAIGAYVCKKDAIAGPCDDCVIDTDPNGSSWTIFNSSTCNDEDPNAGEHYEPIITDLSNSTTCIKQFECATPEDFIFIRADAPSVSVYNMCSNANDTSNFDTPFKLYCINGTYSDEGGYYNMNAIVCRNQSTVVSGYIR